MRPLLSVKLKRFVFRFAKDFLYRSDTHIFETHSVKRSCIRLYACESLESVFPDLPMISSLLTNVSFYALLNDSFLIICASIACMRKLTPNLKCIVSKVIRIINRQFHWVLHFLSFSLDIYIVQHKISSIPPPNSDFFCSLMLKLQNSGMFS